MKIKAIVWANFGHHPYDQLLFADGTLLEGMGPRQAMLQPTLSDTLGNLRSSFGDDDIGRGLPDDTPCWLYRPCDDDGVAVVVAEVTLA